MKQVTVDGHEYSIDKMDAISQFHLARRLGPIFASAKNDSTSALFALSKLSDEEAEKIIFPCLAVVKRMDAGKPMAVLVGKRLMYQDISMPNMFNLVMDVIEENLTSFLDGSPAGSAAPTPQE